MADILDKVKQGISKGVAIVTVKSKEILEVTKLKNQINTLQKQKQRAIEELGNIVYPMFLKASIDETRIKDRGSAILKIDRQIEDLKNEIVQVQNKSRRSLGVVASIGKCTCGAELYEDTKVCSGCGKEVEAVSASAIPTEVPTLKVVCSQCNAELTSDSMFCHKCGAKVF